MNSTFTVKGSAGGSPVSAAGSHQAHQEGVLLGGQQPLDLALARPPALVTPQNQHSEHASLLVACCAQARQWDTWELLAHSLGAAPLRERGHVWDHLIHRPQPEGKCHNIL